MAYSSQSGSTNGSRRPPSLVVVTKKSSSYESASESSPFFADMKSGYLSADENAPLMPMGGDGDLYVPPFSCTEFLWSWIPTEFNLGCFKRVITGDRFRIFCILVVMMIGLGFVFVFVLFSFVCCIVCLFICCLDDEFLLFL